MFIPAAVVPASGTEDWWSELMAPMAPAAAQPVDVPVDVSVDGPMDGQVGGPVDVPVHRPEHSPAHLPAHLSSHRPMHGAWHKPMHGPMHGPMQRPDEGQDEVNSQASIAPIAPPAAPRLAPPVSAAPSASLTGAAASLSGAAASRFIPPSSLKRAHDARAAPKTCPEGALDLSPLLRQVRDLPWGKTFHNGHYHTLSVVAETIAKSPRVYLQADEKFWQLAEQTRQPFTALLTRPFSRQTRPAGMQAVLTHFRDLWTTVHSVRSLPSTPLILHKAVPLDVDLIEAAGYTLPVTLGAQHPEGHRQLAATAGSSAAFWDVPGTAGLRAALSLVSVPGALRLVTGPRKPEEGGTRSVPSLLDQATTQWQAVFRPAADQSMKLSSALDQFNRKVPTTMRLKLRVGLPAHVAEATLQPGSRASHDLMVWFDYRLLASAGRMDERLKDPGTLDVLNRCRSKAARDVDALSRHAACTPLPAETFRRDVVIGCAVQLWIEARQADLPDQDKQIRFGSPIEEIMDLLTFPERRMVDALRAKIRSQAAGGARSAPAGTTPSVPLTACVHEQSGYPMNCMLVVHPPAPRSPLGDSHPAGTPVTPTATNTHRESMEDTTMFDALVSTVAADIRQSGHWQLLSAKLPPLLLQGCTGWPIGRPLEVVQARSLQGTGVVSGRGGPGEPVRILQSPETGRYAGWKDGQRVEVAQDGDSFYAAVLASLSDAERQALLQACGLHGRAMASPSAAVMALRDHFADYLILRRTDYRKLIIDLTATT